MVKTPNAVPNGNERQVIPATTRLNIPITGGTVVCTPATLVNLLNYASFDQAASEDPVPCGGV